MIKILMFITIIANFSLGQDRNQIIADAQAGDANAQYKLAGMYLNGEGMLKDPQKAFFWYKKSAEQGHAKGQTLLGTMYNSGTGTKQDSKKAFYWFLKSAKQGYEWGQLAVGSMYLEGNGVLQNYKEAAKWIEKAYYSGSKLAGEIWKEKELWKYR